MRQPEKYFKFQHYVSVFARLLYVDQNFTTDYFYWREKGSFLSYCSIIGRNCPDICALYHLVYGFNVRHHAFVSVWLDHVFACCRSEQAFGSYKS